MTIRPGAMRKRIEVQKYTTARAADGGNVNSFVTENTVWANINPISALERAQGDQIKAVRSHRITMRFYSDGIDETARIKFGTRIFSIFAVINPGERGCLTILDVKEGILKDV